MLGLVGPRQHRKTTVVADFAGHAKRYETAAKERRKEIGTLPSCPIIMVDQVFSNDIDRLGLVSDMSAEDVVVNVKDVSGRHCVAWQVTKQKPIKLRLIDQSLGGIDPDLTAKLPSVS